MLTGFTSRADRHRRLLRVRRSRKELMRCEAHRRRASLLLDAFRHVPCSPAGAARWTLVARRRILRERCSGTRRRAGRDRGEGRSNTTRAAATITGMKPIGAQAQPGAWRTLCHGEGEEWQDDLIFALRSRNRGHAAAARRNRHGFTAMSSSASPAIDVESVYKHTPPSL